VIFLNILLFLKIQFNLLCRNKIHSITVKTPIHQRIGVFDWKNNLLDNHRHLLLDNLHGERSTEILHR